MLNSRDIDRLRPDVAANCRAWLELCRAAGLLVLVTGTVRDDEYQRYCYEQGTAATPYPSTPINSRSSTMLMSDAVIRYFIGLRLLPTDCRMLAPTLCMTTAMEPKK